VAGATGRGHLWFLLGALLLCLAAIVWWGSWRSHGPRHAPGLQAGADRAVPEPAAPRAVSPEAARRALQDAPAHEGGPARRSWRGWVLEEGTGRELAGYRVQLEVPAALRSATEDAPGSLTFEATTAADGSFTLRSPEEILPAALLPVVVFDDLGERAYEGHVILADDMVLFVKAPLLLHGRILDAAQVCDGPVAFALSQQPAGFAGQPTVLLRGFLDDDGGFAGLARPAWPRLPVDLWVTCGGFSCALHTDLPTLSSAAGFAGHLGLSRTVLTVREKNGIAVPGARVWAAPPGSPVAGTASRRSTDEAGRTTLLVPRNGLEVTVWADGYRLSAFHLPGKDVPREWQVLLEPLDDQCFLEGRVSTCTGEPVAGAVVTALPDLPSDAPALIHPARSRSDEGGWFRFPVGTDGIPVEVTTFHPDFGMSPVQRLVPAGQRLAFFLPGARRLRVHAVAPGNAAEAGAGDVQLCVIPLDDEVDCPAGGRPVALAQDGVLPLETEPVPAGRFLLALYAPGLDLYGEATVQVDASRLAEPREVVVFLQPAAYFEGTVEGATPGVLVRHRNPDWRFPDIWNGLGHGLVGSDGSFRVLAGSRDSGTLEVLGADDQVPATTTAVAGQPVRVVLPR